MFSSQTVRIFYRFPYFRKSDRKWNRTGAWKSALKKNTIFLPPRSRRNTSAS
jgi:hypothetical protein